MGAAVTPGLRPVQSVGAGCRLVQRFMAPPRDQWWFDVAPSIDELRSHHALSIDDAPGYGLVRANLGSKESRDDQAFNALMQVIQAAHGVRHTYLDHLRYHHNFDFVLVLPVLVVDVPLFECWLDVDNEMHVDEIDTGTIVWRNRVSDQDGPHSIVKIVREERLSDYLVQVADLARLIASERTGVER